MIDVPPQVNDIRLGFEDAGVALMPPRYRNIPDETAKALASCLVITTFSAVTTDASWLVPSSTNALTNSMWQSSEICEVLSTGAFTLFCHDVHGFTEDFLSFVTFCFCILLTRLSARCLPSSWLDTASFRSCLLLPPGFLDTLEAGI